MAYCIVKTESLKLTIETEKFAYDLYCQRI